MKNLVLVLMVAVAVVAAYFAGRYRGSHEQVVASAVARNLPPAEPREPRSTRSSVTAGNESGPSSSRQMAVGPDAAAATPAPVNPLDGLRVLIDLQQRGILNNTPGIVRYGKVDPRFAALYALTPEQTSAFQQILDAAHEKMATLTQANAKITAQDSDRVVIDIASFPADGGAIYDGTYASITALLGPERAAAFKQLSSTALENEFSGFGAAQRTVTVTRTGSTDNPYSKIEDTWVQTTEKNTVTAKATYNLRTTEDLARLALGSALPQPFQQLPVKPGSIAGGSETSFMSKGR